MPISNPSVVELVGEFVIGEEGLRLKSYKDSGDIWTIGFGHTSDDYFRVEKGTVITKEKAYDLLTHDLQEADDTLKRQFPNWNQLNINQYSALLSFTYNLGSLKKYDKIKKRYVDRTILFYLKKGRWADAANSFNLYIRDSKGKIQPGLVKRRQREKELFLKL